MMALIILDKHPSYDETYTIGRDGYGWYAKIKGVGYAVEIAGVWIGGFESEADVALIAEKVDDAVTNAYDSASYS